MSILKANHASGSDPSVVQSIKHPSHVPSVPGSNPAAAAVFSAFPPLALRESFKTFFLHSEPRRDRNPAREHPWAPATPSWTAATANRATNDGRNV